MTLLQIAVQWISVLVTAPKNYYHTHTRMKVVPFKSRRLKKKKKPLTQSARFTKGWRVSVCVCKNTNAEMK